MLWNMRNKTVNCIFGRNFIKIKRGHKTENVTARKKDLLRKL